MCCDWKVLVVVYVSELCDMFGEIMCGIFDLSGGYVDVIGSIVLICVLMCDVVWVVFVDVG